MLGLVLGESRETAGLVVHQAVEADHHQLGQLVVAADREVRGIVAGRDLERAGAELGLDPLVGDHRHAPADHRHDHLAADRVAVALVVRVHRDGDVGEDRRHAHRRDRDDALPVGERVADVAERVVHLDVLDLEVGDRGARRPGTS